MNMTNDSTSPYAYQVLFVIILIPGGEMNIINIFPLIINFQENNLYLALDETSK